MTLKENLEIRKLPPRHIAQLSVILELEDEWKKLMAIIPALLNKTNYECCITQGNPPKYTRDDIRIIETASNKRSRTGTEILIDEWGCSGRIRPAIGHLLHLLVQAELFRAADYVAVNILNTSKPARPTTGPAALIEVNVNKTSNSSLNIDKNLDKMEINSSLIENIPQIIITPDADKELPNFLNEPVIQDEVSSMIKFSGNTMTSVESSIYTESENETTQDESELNHSQNTELTNKEESVAVDVLPNFELIGHESGNNLPLISALIEQNSISLSTNNSNESNESDNLPRLDALISEKDNNVVRIPSIEEIKISTQIDEDDSKPDLNFLILGESRRSSLSPNSSNSSKSRQCVSPLPNLTLNTNLPHFSYIELEEATNEFNENLYENLNDTGRLLGAGAFGKVFLATGLFDNPVAVKKLLLENTEVVTIDDMVTKQFKNEVEVLSKFKHENLLSLLGYSCDGCTYCLLYEYISGGTLKDRLQNVYQKLTWEERFPIALGTSKAISYLHTAFVDSPLIHRDVKTANILLDSSNIPKLGDFGVTKLLNNPNTNTYAIIGTSAYMAPEVLRGDISIKCDTFSFGVVLLELLTSLPIFDDSRDGCDLVTHFEAHCDGSIQPLLDVSIGDWVKNDINFGEELYSIAVKCLGEKKKRPIMVDVTKLLNEVVNKL